MRKFLCIVVLFSCTAESPPSKPVIVSPFIVATMRHTAGKYAKLIVQTELNCFNIYAWCLELGIKFPEVVIAQARIESNNFKSGICKRHNNILGLHKAHKRKTTATDKGNIAADYLTWIDCLRDYKLRNDYFHGDTCQTVNSFLLFLRKSHYCKTSGYIKVIKKML